MNTICHVCREPCDDSCVRCTRPTCNRHFYDQHQLGVCQPCVDEIDRAGGPTNWPYPLRQPLEPDTT